ncbi:MAG: 2-dehydropantoate 2-reductase [Deltaproteobacteria bacterium]|nr:2-dehydropantoate 2-reductase [Deltaproteobacteria bacterium]MBW2284477.1 2-dehydropantoate 2-reductase [Deltaproteobacteria bacterium]
MNFLVVGPGAMGCLFAARLRQAGHGVTLLDYRSERAERINRQGIHVTGVTGEFHASVPAVTGQTPEKPDMVLICVKAVSTADAARELQTWLPPETRILTLQNGLGNVEILEEVFGNARVLGGVTSEAATLLETGRIKHAGRGQTYMGPEAALAGPAAGIVSAFNDAGFETQSATDVVALIWGKLIVNVGINALTAITRLKNGRLPDVAGTREVMADAVREATDVAEAKGIRLPYPDALERVHQVCDATAENIASMLQDVLNQRRTEVEFINGAISREGALLGISTPVNRTLTRLIRAIETTYEERERH